MDKLKIIIGSTRRGRAGPSIGRWASEQDVVRRAFDVELIDLADLDRHAAAVFGHVKASVAQQRLDLASCAPRLGDRDWSGHKSNVTD